MDNMIELIAALVVGLGLGFFLARLMNSNKGVDESSAPQPKWWEIRKSLTGTQLQILQYMEGRKEATIENLQEKFSSIPDRELYYRLEQICLLGFVLHERVADSALYSLNPDYSETVEDDKTVILTPD